MDLGGSEQERNKDDLTPKRPEPQKESCHIPSSSILPEDGAKARTRSCRSLHTYIDIIYIDIDI